MTSILSMLGWAFGSILEALAFRNCEIFGAFLVTLREIQKA